MSTETVDTDQGAGGTVISYVGPAKTHYSLTASQTTNGSSSLLLQPLYPNNGLPADFDSFTAFVTGSLGGGALQLQVQDNVTGNIVNVGQPITAAGTYQVKYITARGVQSVLSGASSPNVSVAIAFDTMDNR